MRHMLMLCLDVTYYVLRSGDSDGVRARIKVDLHNSGSFSGIAWEL